MAPDSLGLGLLAGAAAAQVPPTLRELVGNSAVFFVIAAIGAVARVAFDARRNGRLPGAMQALLSLVMSFAVGFGAFLLPIESFTEKGLVVLLAAFAGDMVLERVLSAFGKNGILAKAIRAYLLRWATSTKESGDD